jgi:hypothetical protein
MINNLALNGFLLELSAKSFSVRKLDFPDNKGLKQLRSEHEDWFIYWREGVVYGLARIENPGTVLGTEQRELCKDHLPLIASRITDLLPAMFPQYEGFRRRPFSFVGRRPDEEIVERAARLLTSKPVLLRDFTIRPAFELEAKVIETRTNDVCLGLFLNIHTNWQIAASLNELQKACVDLRGLCVVRKEYVPGERRLVGEIERIENGTVHLGDGFDDIRSIPCDEVLLEGSKQSFARCLKTILGSSYDGFERQRQEIEAVLLSGPEIDARLEQFGTFLSKADSLKISSELNCRVGDQMSVTNTDDYKSIISASGDRYCFDPARSKTAEYAWPGIKNYGPFSKDTFPKRSPNILVVFPRIAQGQTETFLKHLRDGVDLPGGDSQYPGGFAKLFSLVNPSFQLCKVPTLEGGTTPGESYRKAIEEHLSGAAAATDAAIVILLDEQSRLSDADNPYLSSKATLLMAGIPSQELRLSQVSKTPKELQYILQNVSIALYAKMNGTPWTVNQDKTISDELVIGIGSTEVHESRFSKKQRFIGITTVFQGDGNYLLGHISKECTYAEYPAVLLASTKDILSEIKKRNGWNPGDNIRLIFHSYKPLKKIEIAEITKEAARSVGNEQTIDFAFLTVSFDHPFLCIDRAQPGVSRQHDPKGKTKGKFAPERGTILQIGRYTRLLSTNGPKLIKREPAPLPAPLLIHLHRQSTFQDLAYLSEQVLKFTSLSWRSTLPARKPVSIYYSELIAELLGRLRHVKDWTPAVLNMKLRASRWFL